MGLFSALKIICLRTEAILSQCTLQNRQEPLHARKPLPTWPAATTTGRAILVSQIYFSKEASASYFCIATVNHDLPPLFPPTPQPRSSRDQWPHELVTAQQAFYRLSEAIVKQSGSLPPASKLVKLAQSILTSFQQWTNAPPHATTLENATEIIGWYEKLKQMYLVGFCQFAESLAFTANNPFSQGMKENRAELSRFSSEPFLWFKITCDLLTTDMVQRPTTRSFAASLSTVKPQCST